MIIITNKSSGVKMNEEQIKDKLTKVCICKAISRATIKEAIREGAKSVEEVKRRTGATTGACQGGRCTHVIEGLINSAE